MNINKAFYPLWISSKFIAHSTKSKYTKVITLTTVLGIALSVATLLIVLSIMNGFTYIAKTKVMNLLPHISINLNDDYDPNIKDAIKLSNFETSHKLNSAIRISQNILNKEQIKNIYPTFQAKVFVINNQQLIPLYINAIPTKVLKDKLVELNSVKQREQADNQNPDQYLKGIVISSSILEKLDNKQNISFSSTENLFKFYNADVIDSFEATDPIMGSIALMDINYAKEIFQNANLALLNIDLNNPNNAPLYAEQLKEQITFTVNNWTRYIGNYFKILDYTKQIMFFLLSCIVIVAMFNTVATLSTTLNEKQNGIAIIKTMGGNNALLIQVFSIYGFLLTSFGLLLGLILGIILSYNITYLSSILESFLGYKLIDSKMYFVDYLPAKVLTSDIFNIISFVYLITALAIIYPIRKACKITPIQVLKYV